MQPLHSQYIKLTGDEEDRRLQLQNRALQYFDEDVYRRAFRNYASPLILDVGCGTGDMISGMTDGNPDCKIFGIDIMQRQIDRATKQYPQGKFAVLNIEQDSFLKDMRQWLDAEGVQGFDVISCSMILLHLSDPVKALAKLRALLNKGGVLIVREIDDGLQYAWPDPEGLFKKCAQLFAGFDRLGDRHCGRKVYSYLKNAGFRYVRIEKEGLSSTSIPGRKLLFEMIFPPFMNHMKQRSENEPENIQYREAYEWCANNISKIQNFFDREDFAFSMGFMSFTAI
ncbi:MAG: methyltransferase domain-containing protein [bacterium]|nr:methyltransferase domain-containing protein [bacterium]